MVKHILVACGNGIATSTVVATKIRQYLAKEGIDADTTQTRLTEVPGKVASYDALVTTGQFFGETSGVPYIAGMPLLTGIGTDAALQQLKDALTN
ncbi:MAG: PTS sugar transporter subunit IIB [Lactobacillus sp.]|nr:PTS sugar transporter subunit IIB [Lactobacillus sp.]MDN6052789.1 PTS sugar transporter subunit IIB [Lactobacillus sp.]